MTTLGSACEVIAGQSPEGIHYNQNGVGEPFYQGKKEFGDRFVGAATTWTTRVTKQANSGDIVMSVRAPVGPVNILRSSACIGRGLAAIRPRSGVDRDFIYYQLQAMQNQIAGTEGAIFASINKGQIEALPIWLPPLAEQQRIVARLDEVDAGLRTLSERLDAELLRCAQVRLRSMQTVFEAASDPRYCLKEVCEVRNGATPDTKIAHYWDGSHAWVTPAEMGGLESPYMSATRRKLTDRGLNACSASLAPVKSVILSSRAPIGHLIINEVPMATNQGCKTLVPGSRLNYKYLYYFLKTNVQLLESLGTGTTFLELSASKLKEVPIPVPPLIEQQRVVAIVDEVQSLCASVSANIECRRTKAGKLRQSVLAAAFRGDL